MRWKPEKSRKCHKIHPKITNLHQIYEISYFPEKIKNLYEFSEDGNYARLTRGIDIPKLLLGSYRNIFLSL